MGRYRLKNFLHVEIHWVYLVETLRRNLVVVENLSIFYYALSKTFKINRNFYQQLISKIKSDRQKILNIIQRGMFVWEYAIIILGPE